MRLLLDTHVVLWWLADDPTLSDEVKTMLDEELEVYLSPVIIWEVAIKKAVGKIEGPVELPELVWDAEFADLPVTPRHALIAGRLPLIHRDPFDRMLVAQARCEGLTLVTRDAQIQKYDVPVLAV